MAETWLSQDAYERLRGELSELKTQGRPRISAEIEAARSHGDLKENAEYHTAKDEQGRMEARIRQLEILLREAEVGETPPADEVRPGVVVTLDIEGDRETYLLGSREEAENTHLDVLSAESPMGRSIVGLKAGDTTSFQTPTGVKLDVTVEAIERP